MVTPKYARLERERRWFVNVARLPPLEPLPHKHIEDKYLTDTRLRLRKVTDGPDTVYKLCKKYGKTHSAEAIVNVYLSETEYGVLNAVPGHRLEKLRYAFEGGALDVFRGTLEGLFIFEVEFGSEREALSFTPPDFAAREVTDVLEYEGASLAEHGPPSL